MENKEIICISCPMGCRLSASYNEDFSVVEISGNACPRGESYGKDELINPKRMLTTTVKVLHSHIKTLPVKTAEPISKSRIFEALKELKGVEVRPPIKIGDIIKKDIAQTGVDIVACYPID